LLCNHMMNYPLPTAHAIASRRHPCAQDLTTHRN
jgi:hypothetical protein